MESRKKYPLPDFLADKCSEDVYRRWLDRKTGTHYKRDCQRGMQGPSRAAYKEEIHRAVVDSRGLDAYTGRELRWDLIGTYDNERSTHQGRSYKKNLGDLPTLDHYDIECGELKFKICSWRVNDAKNDLTLDEFLVLCRDVLRWHEEGGR